jgi:hypothetical protein
VLTALAVVVCFVFVMLFVHERRKRHYHAKRLKLHLLTRQQLQTQISESLSMIGAIADKYAKQSDPDRAGDALRILETVQSLQRKIKYNPVMPVDDESVA